MTPAPVRTSAAQDLTIDWASMPTYNTIMTVAVGVGLVGLVLLGRGLLRDPAEVSTDGWALLFGVLGAVLTLTGAHMTLTWPLASGGFPYDNIIFGEPSLGFGVLLLAASVFLWRRGGAMTASPDAVAALARVARPVSLFVAGLGLSLLRSRWRGSATSSSPRRPRSRSPASSRHTRWWRRSSSPP